MVKYIQGWRLVECLEEIELDDKINFYIEELKKNPSFRISEDDDYIIYRDNYELTEALQPIKEFLDDNEQGIRDYLDDLYTGDEHEEITLCELVLDLSGHTESGAIVFDDEKAEEELFSSDDPFKYIEETLYFARSMEIANEVSNIIYNIQNSPYNMIDWNIIIDAIPKEEIHKTKIFEVFDAEGNSKGFYENYNEEMALIWAYNSLNPDNKVLFDNEIEVTNWTASEVQVYGFLPNRQRV